ncbi:phosphoenolpyruvate carboxykinase (GTP), partial [bacterium]|nr:phosphoenolpyruvate carboxykinase (GTP) [bacterium]
QDTPIGRVPTAASLDLSGLDLAASDLDLLLTVDPAVWTEEAALIPPAYEAFGERLPEELWRQHRALEGRLQAAVKTAEVVAE